MSMYRILSLKPVFIPCANIDSLTDEEIVVLWQAIQETLQESIDLGGAMWEQNLYGEHGGMGSC